MLLTPGKIILGVAGPVEVNGHTGQEAAAGKERGTETGHFLLIYV